MKTITYYEEGDQVEITQDWRLWKKGDVATVKKTTWERGIGSSQILTLQARDNHNAESDFSSMLDYNVKIITPEEQKSHTKRQMKIGKWATGGDETP